jgi:hypothetical protein
MRIGSLPLLPILLLPQFLACGEGARPKGAATAGHVGPAQTQEQSVDEAADVRGRGDGFSDGLTAVKPSSGSTARGKTGNATASKGPGSSSR